MILCSTPTPAPAPTPSPPHPKADGNHEGDTAAQTF